MTTHIGESCYQPCVIIRESNFEEYYEEKTKLWKEAGKSFPDYFTKHQAQIEGRKFYLASTD